LYPPDIFITGSDTLLRNQNYCSLGMKISDYTEHYALCIIPYIVWRKPYNIYETKIVYMDNFAVISVCSLCSILFN